MRTSINSFKPSHTDRGYYTLINDQCSVETLIIVRSINKHGNIARIVLYYGCIIVIQYIYHYQRDVISLHISSLQLNAIILFHIRIKLH